MEAALKQDVIFQPIPGSSQELAIETRCHHTLYHGTRGPGKTITQLMRFRRRVGLGYGEYWRGIIFDREYKDLSDIIAQSKRFFYKFEDGGKFLESPSELKWMWPTGEQLLFRHVKKTSDYDSFHGHEYPFLGWNELTKHPTSELYDQMMSTNRSSFVPEIHTPHSIDKDGNKVYLTYDGKPLPPIPLEVFSTTNPNGPGHNWVKRRFINVARNGEVVKKPVIVFDPKTKKDVEIVKTQIAIFGSYKENIYLDPLYIAELDNLTSNNPNLRKAWLEGNWDFTAGGAIDDLWNRDTHVLPRFKVPHTWLIDRSFDWGSTHPASVCWWAESNGEEVEMDDGTKLNFPAGTLIQIAEWYITTEIGSNKGLKLTAKEIAQGIREREVALMKDGWIAEQPQPGPADNQINDVRERNVDSIALKMADEGVRWNSSDKSAGSRINGLQLFRDRLKASLDKEGAGIYFMSNCNASIETLPALPRDSKKPDDVDTDSEDHVWDAVRYRVLAASNRFATELKFKFPI